MSEADTIFVFKGLDGLWRWHRIAANNRIVSSSGESFDSKSNGVRAAEAEVERGGGELQVKDDE